MAMQRRNEAREVERWYDSSRFCRAKALTRWMMPPALSDRRAMRATTGATSSRAMLRLQPVEQPVGEAAQRAQRLVPHAPGRATCPRATRRPEASSFSCWGGQPLGAFALADVQHRTHPAHLLAQRGGQGRLVDQHIHQVAVAVLELHFQAFVAGALGDDVAVQQAQLSGLVRGPVGHGADRPTSSAAL